MKKLVFNLFLSVATVAIFGFTFTACKGKVKDADIQTAITTALSSNPDFSPATVSVVDGVASISGEIKDEATKTAVETAVKAVTGIKSVTNSLTVAPPPPPPVVIAADDPLTTAVKDAIKDNGSVIADVKDGIVTLTGEIKKADLPQLMKKIMALKPKKVITDGLTKK